MRELEILQKRLPGLRQNVPLKQYTTFRIGGPAKYFFVAKTRGDILKGVRAAAKCKLPILLLSGGSNVLIADDDFPGLVVKIQNSKFKIRNSSVWAEAGTPMAFLVRETGKRGLSGLEWAGGLPGTLGGAVRGNAGAFGGEIKDSIVRVEAVDRNGKKRMFSKKQCSFSYRSSIFKKNGCIILAATLLLKKGSKRSIEAVARGHMRYRKERHPLEYPSAGSVFKNCELEKVPPEVREQFAHVVKLDSFPVIPAAAIIAKAQLQGLRVGGAEVSPKHPNYIVNCGNAHAKDVLRLIEKVKKHVKQQFGIDLEEEISFLH